MIPRTYMLRTPHLLLPFLVSSPCRLPRPPLPPCLTICCVEAHRSPFVDPFVSFPPIHFLR